MLVIALCLLFLDKLVMGMRFVVLNLFCLFVVNGVFFCLVVRTAAGYMVIVFFYFE
jgi:hypothetical protein